MRVRRQLKAYGDKKNNQQLVDNETNKESGTQEDGEKQDATPEKASGNQSVKKQTVEGHLLHEASVHDNESALGGQNIHKVIRADRRTAP